jgi:hypothetical protein
VCRLPAPEPSSDLPDRPVDEDREGDQNCAKDGELHPDLT